MKSRYTLVLGVLLITSLIFLSQQEQTSASSIGANEIHLKIQLLGPYGQVISENKTGLNLRGGNNRKKSPERVESVIDLKNPDNYFTRNSIDSSDFCGEGGGKYKLYYFLRSQYKSQKFENEDVLSESMFECSTPKQLLEIVKVPSNWEDDNLLVYCSDINRGKDKIEIDFSIPSFLYSKGFDNDYGQIGCLIKNEDRDEKNSIFYGFPYGNYELQKERKNFFNETADDPFILMSNYSLIGSPNLDDSTNMMKFERLGGEDIAYMSYFSNAENPYYIVSNFDDAVSSSKLLRDVFDLNFIYDETSRSIMLRKGENRSIYGYLTYETMKNSINKENKANFPLYVINYQGFGSVENMCMDSLSTYEPEMTDSRGNSITCQTKDIVLREENIRDDNPKDLTFTLFKNIITQANLEGETSSIVGPPYGSYLNRDIE